VLWHFILAASIGGFGLGFMQPTLSGRVSELCGASQRGISAGMFQTLKNIGGSMASAIGSAVFTSIVISGTTRPSKNAYLIVFGGCLFVSACMALVIAAGPGSRLKNLQNDVADTFRKNDAIVGDHPALGHARRERVKR
jgi:MFS family permease